MTASADVAFLIAGAESAAVDEQDGGALRGGGVARANHIERLTSTDGGVFNVAIGEQGVGNFRLGAEGGGQCREKKSAGTHCGYSIPMGRGDDAFGVKARKRAPFEFVLEALAELRPRTNPMFGCLAVYVGPKIVLILRDRPTATADNGVWLATTAEHHESLRRDFPRMRSIGVLGKEVTGWQVLAADAPDFEEMALRACELVIAGDARIGKVPGRRRSGDPRDCGSADRILELSSREGLKTMSANPAGSISVAVIEGDALTLDTDVLAVKHAHAHYGVDRVIANALRIQYPDLNELMPRENASAFLASAGTPRAASVLFVGVKRLDDFGYADIRDFSRRVMSAVAEAQPLAEHIALTLHGAGYGLDEKEAFESELAGLVDGIMSGDFPAGLRRISIVELNPGRAGRLKDLLHLHFKNGLICPGAKSVRLVDERLRLAGNAAAIKPYAFVAMPFAEEMNDLYDYGITNAVRGAGYLCERIDQASFTGDVLDSIKRRSPRQRW